MCHCVSFAGRQDRQRKISIFYTDGEIKAGYQKASLPKPARDRRQSAVSQRSIEGRRKDNMKLKKVSLMLIMITALSLAYIELQLQIVDLAYEGRNKQLRIQKIKDANGDIVQNICVLKSANNLGIKLLSEDSELQFADNQQMVELEAPEQFAGKDDAKLAEATVSRLNFFAQLFSLKSQAEAVPIR